MDWSAQTTEMMKTWSEAQKRLWGGWMEWAQSAAAMGQKPQGFDPTQLFRVGADTWSGLREGSPERLVGTILGTPEIMTRSLNLLMQAWQSVAPKIEQGKPWQPDLEKLVDQWRAEVSALPKRAASMSSDFAELTKTLFERWTPMTAPWLSMLSEATAAGHPAAAFLSGTATPSRLAGFGEAFQGMIGQYSLGEMPRATVAREKMGKFLKVYDTISDLQKAQSDYKDLLSRGLSESIAKTIEHLAKLAEKGDKVTSARDLMRTWFSIADRTLMNKFNTAEFLEIQEKLTNALMAHKTAQRNALEIVYNSLEIPTRSEIDEAYRDLHELKREVRALRRQLKDSTGKAAHKGKKAAKEIEATEVAS